MNKLTIKACPLCGGTHLERALTCVDHYASGEMFHLCRCRDCGFLFTQDFPVEAEIGRYYETPDYISHTDTRKGAMNSVYHWVRNYMLGRKARLVLREAHRKEGSLLDLGTGTGYFADVMQVGGIFQMKDLFLTPAKLPGDQSRIFADPAGMAESVFILCLNGDGQGM